MRKRIFEIIEIGKEGDTASRAYDIAMIVVIVISLIPLVFKQNLFIFKVVENVTTGIFLLDYILRICTADYKLQKGRSSFIRYPFTAMAIIDILSILPTFIQMNPGFRVLKAFRLMRALKVFRFFRGFRYSKNFTLIASVMKRQKSSLIAVCVVAVGYILATALIMFNVEPDTFDTFFNAIYWATISLTTMGYGDIYATSSIGQVITMISALFGIAVVALPAGIISAGFMAELEEKKKEKEEQ